MVHAVGVPELKFIDVEMHVFLADLVERSYSVALHDGPEPFDGICMNGSAQIFALPVMPKAMLKSARQEGNIDQVNQIIRLYVFN